MNPMLVIGVLDSVTRLAIELLPERLPEGEMTPELRERLATLTARLADLNARVLERKPAHPVD